MTQRDYYQILGVDNNADSKRLKRLTGSRPLPIIRIETKRIRKLLKK